MAGSKQNFEASLTKLEKIVEQLKDINKREDVEQSVEKGS